MSTVNTPANSNNNEQVYGFLCPQTNVFYAFDSYETYQQFMEWLHNQAPQNDDAACQPLQREDRPMVNEADQMEDFEKATN